MAKRPVQNSNEVTTHYSIFKWYECDFCKQEFRRENGYKWPCWNFFKYSCGSCSGSVSHCSDNIDHKRDTASAKIMGKIPPPPPMRTYRRK